MAGQSPHRWGLLREPLVYSNCALDASGESAWSYNSALVTPNVLLLFLMMMPEM